MARNPFKKKNYDFIEHGAVENNDPLIFQIGDFGNLMKRLSAHHVIDEEVVEYDQGAEAWSRAACTLVQPTTCISSYWNVPVTSNFIKGAFHKGNYVEGQGNLTSHGAKTYVDHWNESYKKKAMFYFVADVDSKEVDIALSKNIAVGFTHRGNSKYNKDTYDNFILDNTEFGTPTYGHTLSRINNKEGQRWCLNNYASRGEYNNYWIPEDNIKSLLDNGVIYRRAYIYLSQEEVSDLLNLTPEEVKLLGLTKRMNSILWGKYDQYLIGGTDFEGDYRMIQEQLKKTNDIIRGIERKAGIPESKPL